MPRQRERSRATPAPSAIKRSLELSPETQALLVQSARRQRVGWPDLFAAAVGGYVARMAGSASARIGVPLMNRTVSGVGALPSAQTVCTAMNVLPVTVPADGTVAEALAATTAEQAAVRAHPFARQEALARRLAQLTGGQLFGAQVNVVPFELELRLGAATGVVRNLTAGPVEDMTVCLRGTPGRRRVVRLEIDANPELYAVDEVELHLTRLTEWLAAYAGADPEAPVREVPLLPDAERELVTLAFNDTAVERRPDTLGARFAAQAARTPEATALVFRGETRTYAQLLDAAKAYARGGAAAVLQACQPRAPRSGAVEMDVHDAEDLHAALRPGGTAEYGPGCGGQPLLVLHDVPPVFVLCTGAQPCAAV